MERRYSLAGSAAYLNGMVSVAASGGLVWALLSGWYQSTLIPLPGAAAAIVGAALLAAVSGAVWLYAGSQISYGIPGWSREGAVAFAGGIVTGAATCALVSVAVGAVLLAANLAGLALLVADPDGRMHPFRIGTAGALLLVALLPAGIVGAADLGGSRIEQNLRQLQPERNAEAAQLLSEGLPGTRQFAATSTGALYEGLPGYDEMLQADGRSRFYAIGSVEPDGCRSWGTQSLSEMGGGSFLLLSSGEARRGHLPWYRGPEGPLAYEDSGPYSMMPYLPTLRAAAAAGNAPAMGICSLLDGVSRSVTEVREDGEGEYTLILDPGRAELAARVGHVLRSFTLRERSGISPALNALETITGQATPDLRDITTRTRQIRLRFEGSELVHLSTLVEAAGDLVAYDSIGFRAAEGDSPPPASGGEAERAGILVRALLR